MSQEDLVKFLRKLNEDTGDAEGESFRELPPSSYLDEFTDPAGKFSRYFELTAKKQLLMWLFLPEKLFGLLINDIEGERAIINHIHLLRQIIGQTLMRRESI